MGSAIPKFERKYREAVMKHPFFTQIKNGDVSREAVQYFLNQYWHPISFFPTFLASLVAQAPDIKMKAFISKILYQETGEGDPSRAHEIMYLSTLASAGFSASQVVENIPSRATDELMMGYRDGTSDFITGLGFLYGTEMIDLTIVAGLGEAVRKASGVKKLAWVDIHVEQEPDHVECSDQAVSLSFTEYEMDALLESAHRSWALWGDFFTDLSQFALKLKKTA